MANWVQVHVGWLGGPNCLPLRKLPRAVPPTLMRRSEMCPVTVSLNRVQGLSMLEVMLFFGRPQGLEKQNMHLKLWICLVWGLPRETIQLKGMSTLDCFGNVYLGLMMLEWYPIPINIPLTLYMQPHIVYVTTCEKELLRYWHNYICGVCCQHSPTRNPVQQVGWKHASLCWGLGVTGGRGGDPGVWEWMGLRAIHSLYQPLLVSHACFTNHEMNSCS